MATRKIMMAVTPTAVPKDEQQSVIFWFLTLESVSGSEIPVRMHQVNGAQNVITKSIVNRWVQRLKAGQMSTSDEPQSGRLLKRQTHCGMPQASTNSSIDTKNASLGTEIM